jgi:thiosulfate dehydrogenase
VRRLVPLLLLAGCTEEISAAEHGERLFGDPHGISDARSNDVSCATCHQTGETDDANRIDSGHNLHGVANRIDFWGGQTDTMLEAVSTCLVYFMRHTIDPPDRDSEEMVALWEYLVSITPEDAPTDPLPFTVVENIQAIPLGDQARGCEIFDKSCKRCHGDLHSGAGRINDDAVKLPDEAAADYMELFPTTPPGLVVIEKIRHGRFFATPGVMPLYSVEVLSDEEIGDLLACLGMSSEEL